ncbi:MAG: FAD-binding oxidoreductase [Rhodobacteraceae bacterium]|nr:FAD-binding oxidoreductase [Paracoccaceae bacterium]MBR9820779.1 FAD-binding oxidoreductase [Paracoccaceae bacterium]
MKIAVLGAGAIGANIAHRLAVRGAEVVLIDGQAPAAGTSGASFSWLSSFPQLSWAEDPGRRALRLSVNPHFDRLAEELGGDWLDWCGTLTVESAVPAFDGAVERSTEAGAQIEVLDAGDLARIEPHLRLAEGERVAFELRSGWVDAPAMIEQLIRVFRLSGGTLQIGQPVTALRRVGARVIGVTLGDGTQIDADLVVNAAGASATHIAAMAELSIPMELVPGMMLYAGAGATALPRHVINGDRWLLRPDRREGVAIHWRGEGLTAVHGNNGADGPAMLADVAHSVPALVGQQLMRERIGIRAIPFGGPVIGSLPWISGYYSAVSHGGIGWGPIWADLAAREILDGTLASELSGLRPTRFYMDVPER